MKYGKEYWKSLDQLENSPEFEEMLHREFPIGASEFTDPVSRRKFLSIMGASIALAGYVGCRRPIEKIVPYVASPEDIIPGVANYYATSMPFGSEAFGLLVESHEGRPTKIEGNPQHPSTMGRSNVFIQGEILNLYDPDRSKTVLHNAAESSWDDFISFWRNLFASHEANKGAGLAILSEPFSSPTMARLKFEFEAKFPNSSWATYEPSSDENICQGIKIAFGKNYRPQYHFDKAEVIVSLDSDLLYLESDNIRNSRAFTDGRRVKTENDNMNRLYMVEGIYSVTGAMADHRLRLPSSQIASFGLALAAELKKQSLPIEDFGFLATKSLADFDADWIRIAASDLMNARGKSLLVAGRRQPAELHALVFAINNALGNIGSTLALTQLEDTELSDNNSISALVSDINNDKIETLVILGGNPAYNAPANLKFGDTLKKVAHTIQLSSHLDETSRSVEWHLPEAHFLEYWSDSRSYDGTVSVIQPLILPLYGGRSPIEILNTIATGKDLRGYDLVQGTFKTRYIKDKNFDKSWRKVLNDGLLPNSAFAAANTSIDYKAVFQNIQSPPFANQAPDKNNLEVVFTLSPTIYDGRYANNAWHQELPNHQTKIVWDNVAAISPKTAKDFNLENGNLIRLHNAGQDLEIAAWIMPGMADSTIWLNLGYGRKSVGRIGNNVGFDTYLLRTSAAMNFGSGLTFNKTGREYSISTTQNHHSMEGRPIVREATLEHYREHPDFAPEMVETPPLKSLWKEHSFDKGYQWGMAIDLNVCIGCNACAVACYSENNIPVVGKEQVARGREMAWIRVDRYFNGETDDPDMVYQPVPCMHCENAPCEEVCPVNATVHDKEGLNLQVYNRCIGTRYCSNNCPYKVRRFNFFNYTSQYPETVKMAQNPDVTVRSRGVMEKCTYCLQRISENKKKARKENRDLREDEFTAACAQTCPVDAIIFGNINDPESRVAKIKKQNRNYGMLVEYNTRPRTSYLAKIRNPHPELERLEKKVTSNS
jgi:MoCo/4Fe-4S cofactor protein with predicted Tat translocation signal